VASSGLPLIAPVILPSPLPSSHFLTENYIDTPVNIIPVAFLTAIKNPTSVNFANAGDNCTTFPGTQLLSCPQIESVPAFTQHPPTSFPLLSTLIPSVLINNPGGH
jgi:hypothetical protein